MFQTLGLGALERITQPGLSRKWSSSQHCSGTLRMASGSRLGRVVMVMFVGYDTKMCRWRMLQTQIMY
ncbi:hypothetical protein LINPERPRIM_LOCUS6051 [Linum perenne]